jgi:hypothetical protein
MQKNSKKKLSKKFCKPQKKKKKKKDVANLKEQNVRDSRRANDSKIETSRAKVNWGVH